MTDISTLRIETRALTGWNAFPATASIEAGAS